MSAEKIICALDTSNLGLATDVSAKLAKKIGGIKLGLEFFFAHGVWGVKHVAPDGLFLDLKLHDIPKTVEGGFNSILSLQPKWLTVHVSGGKDMLRRAVNVVGNYAAKHRIERAKLLGVTVLTSLNDADLRAMGMPPVREQVQRLAAMADDCDLDGIVASPQEIQLVRNACSSGFIVATPGIRLAHMGPDDQKRTMTPQEAIAAGADLIIMGRALQVDPVNTVNRIVAEIEAAQPAP